MPTELSGVAEYEIAVPDTVLDDLRTRIAATRWPALPQGEGWRLGVDRRILEDVVDHWAHGFDWRAHEAALNAFPQVLADYEGSGVHAVVARSREACALPVVLLHGWPSAVSEFHRVIGPLCDPVAHGGDAVDAFDVVAISLPGFGFSGPTRSSGWDAGRMAGAVGALMRSLGFDRYGAFGTDAGAFVASALAADEPASVVGLHLQLGGVVLARIARTQGEDGTVDEVERRAVEALAEYEAHDSAYSAVNASKPYTIAYALTDSPVGQAAWILEKFRTWTDPGGDPTRPFGLVDVDDALAIVTTYWVSATAASAAEFYAAGAASIARLGLPDVRVPTGCAVYPADIVVPSRRWAQSRYPELVYWTEMPRGGHFGALEVPELFVDDLRAFFRPLR